LKFPVRFTQLFLKNQFVEPVVGGIRDLYSPVTERAFMKVSEASEQDVEKAVEAAQKALPKWTKWNAMERRNFLLKLADKVEGHLEELRSLTDVHSTTRYGV
jgi:aldehyde dehydrogenase